MVPVEGGRGETVKREGMGSGPLPALLLAALLAATLPASDAGAGPTSCEGTWTEQTSGSVACSFSFQGFPIRLWGTATKGSAVHGPRVLVYLGAALGSLGVNCVGNSTTSDVASCDREYGAAGLPILPAGATLTCGAYGMGSSGTFGCSSGPRGGEGPQPTNVCPLSEWFLQNECYFLFTGFPLRVRGDAPGVGFAALPIVRVSIEWVDPPGTPPIELLSCVGADGGALGGGHARCEASAGLPPLGLAGPPPDARLRCVVVGNLAGGFECSSGA